MLGSVFVVVLTACTGTAGNPGATSTGTPISGGTAVFSPGNSDFSWLFPLENGANSHQNDANIEADSWRPLYFAGGAGITGINYNYSLASQPVYSNNDQTVTIKLKTTYKWSDGTPVTTSDVRFYFELEAAGAKNGKFAWYSSGLLPDNIKSITYQGPYQFTMNLTHPYNPEWFNGNQLTWIMPMPQHAWDKTCASCNVVGDQASTPAGASAVYNFLYGQSSQLSTYATDPLWKVVDGPWEISSYDPATYRAGFTANQAYSGPDKPHLQHYVDQPFASDTAELNALRSGQIDYGYLPFQDAPSASTYEALGYTVKPWNNAYFNERMEFGYTNPTYGPLVRQVYIRQALQHLVDEKLYINTTLHGYGFEDYGIGPASPPSSLTSPLLRSDPYPYSVSAATSLLSAHGWVPNSAGVDVCQRPGTASNECGAGIAKGRTLSLLFMYEDTAGDYFASQVTAFATAAKQAGVNITVDGQSTNTMFSTAGVCPPGPCKYGIAGYAGWMDNFGQQNTIPNGNQQFGKGNYWGGGYDDPTAQSLISAAELKPGLGTLYAAENYFTSQVVSLWWPVSDPYILLVKKNLQGWTNLDPYVDQLPQLWYQTK